MNISQVTIISLTNASDRENDIKKVVGDVDYDCIVMQPLPSGLDPRDIDVENIIKTSILNQNLEKPTAYIVSEATPENEMGITKGYVFIAH